MGWARSKGLLILQNVSVNNDEFSAKICFNLKYALIFIILSGILLITFKLEKIYSFEYPSCLFIYEIRLWGIMIFYQKHETYLSSYLKKNDSEIHCQQNMIFPISEKTISLFGCERKTGGTGKDILKFNEVIRRQTSKVKKEDFCYILNLLQKNNTIEFQREVSNLFYGNLNP